MSYENLLYEKRDGIAYITFNRPKVLNALNRKTLEELHHLLPDAKEDASVRVLIDRKSTRLNSSHRSLSRMPSSA